MTKSQKQQNEFRVVISGLALSAEQQERLDRALRQATLQIMAEFDFGGDQAAVAIPLKDGGHTRGLRYVALNVAEAERLTPEPGP